MAIALAAVALGTGICAGAARSDDAAVIDTRQNVMKSQGKDMTAIKAYIDDKADLASAQAAGTDLVTQIGKIPEIFPKGSGMDAYPGKSWAKPIVWSEADKFAATAKTAAEKAAALSAALKGGDKPQITAAFGDMGKNGCGACHETFREKKPS
jgi:cytochrome c556